MRKNSLGHLRSPRTLLSASLLPAVFIIALGLMAFPLDLGFTKSDSAKDIKPNINSRYVPDRFVATKPPSDFLSFLSPPPPPPSVATYAGDCTTPQSVFNLAASEFSICAKVTGGQSGQVILWSNANFIQVQNTPLGTGESTFTLTAASSLGDWRVILYEPFGGSVYALTSFTVVDADNPSADIAVAKAALTNSVSAGSQAVFEIQVANLGPSDATNVELTDSTPANTTLSSFAVVSGPAGINCATLGTDTNCTIPTLAKGQTAVFSATYDVFSGTPSGTIISNTATISSTTPDPRDADDSSTGTTVVTADALGGCTLDCPTNVVVTADAIQGGVPGSFVTFGAASVTGDCGAVSNSPASGSFFTVGTHSIISTSEAGPTCSFSVTVLDTAPPSIMCPPSITATAPSGQTEYVLPDGPGTPTINASGGGTVTGVRSDDTEADYDDNGNLLTPAVIHALTDPYPIGTTGILWTVTDAGGRKASCTQTVTIVAAGDRPPVTITCPSNVTFTAPNGSCEATIPATTIGTPTTNPSDNVTVSPRRSDDLPLSDPFPAGATTITWTATDDLNGSVASCVQTVTVSVPNSGDTTPPSLTVPANVSVTTSSCSATLDDELGTAEATDEGACNGSVTVTRTGVPPNFVFPTGTTTILYTATDAAGNSVQKVQLVTVTESPGVPPSITAPVDVSVNTGPGATSCGTFVSDAALGTATANDNCPGFTVSRSGVPGGNIFPVGTTIVTYRVTDASGNFTEDTQTVTVTDNTAPVVTAPAAITLFTGAGATSCGVTVSNLDTTLGTGSATDNCPGVGSVTRSGVPVGNVFPVGETIVTYSATDAHGNTGSATQTVTVVDNTAPTITCPAAITLEPTCPTGAIATWTEPVGTDNCPGATTTRTAGPASGSVFPVGVTTVTYTVNDAHGNSTSCSFTVTVLTAQATLQGMINTINGLPLSGTQKQGLISKLSAAIDAINQGKTNVACNKLGDFISQVTSFINNGSLTSALGQPLINSANKVRNHIGCTNLPCS